MEMISMMIGNDIVKVPRMQGVCKNQRLVNRIFTKSEQVYIFDVTSTQLQLERMAGKLALKEAVAKAFGVGIGKKLNWLDIETAHQNDGKPCINQTKKIKMLLQKVNLSNIDVSVSHMGDYATAVCLIF